MRKTLRRAELQLHRKISREDNCICGSKMILNEKDLVWECLTQKKYNEPNWVEVIIPNRNIKTRKGKWKI